MNGADARAGQHHDGQLDDHGQKDGDAVALFDAQTFENIGEFVHFAIHVEIGVNFPVVGIVAFKNDRGFVFLGSQMAVEAVIADVELAAFKPFGMDVFRVKRPVRHLIFVKGFEPGQSFGCHFGPESIGIGNRFFIKLVILRPALDVGFLPDSVRHRKNLVIKILFVSFSHIILLQNYFLCLPFPPKRHDFSL